MTWITKDKSIEQGLSIINKLTDWQFSKLLTDICHNVQKKRIQPTSRKLFTNEEINELQQTIELQVEEFNILLNAITLTLNQAICANIDALTLKSTIKEVFHIDEPKINIIYEQWNSQGKSMIRALEEKSVWPNLNAINWSLAVGTSSTIRAKEGQCNVKLQMDLEQEENVSKIAVQLDRQSITNLYENLEKIQAQLDQLKNK